MKKNKRSRQSAAPATLNVPTSQQGQAQLHFRLAETQRLKGELALAVASYRQALGIDPAYFSAHNNLAMSLIGLGRHDEAAIHLQQALAIDPDSVAACINYAIVLKQQQQFDAAEARFRHAIAVAPGFLVAHLNLGNMLREQGQALEAIRCFDAALAIDPKHADAHNSCGLAYWELARFDEAIACYLQAIRFNPRCAPAYTNLGNALLRQGKLAIALQAFRQAVNEDPGYAMAHLNLAGALRDQGLFDQAVDSYRAALACQPGWIDAQQGLLFLLGSMGAGQQPYYLDEVNRFGQLVDQAVDGRAYTSWLPRRPDGRLRVGMVSGDLRRHPVAYFLENILGHLPALGVDVLLYRTASLQDAMTDRLASLCSGGLQSIVGLSDAAAAARIHADAIDVLIDLSGHTFNSRLALFGWRPAPVQASWLGYFATTGVRQIDAILVDAVGVPPGAEAAFTERLCYLPETRLCFSAPADAPLPAPLPALRKGHLSFGCFQHHPKVSDAQLKLWARVLDAVPGSMLRWQCRQFADPQCVNDTAQRLVQSGIGLDRAQLFGLVERQAYLAAHAEVDIILDTSPYPGGTTTCEALWMGVPTVTLAGDTLLSRQGASLLTAAGLADWVADSEDDYVATAVAAAHDLAALAALRAGLRQQVAASPLCDGHRFAVHLRAALLALLDAPKK